MAKRRKIMLEGLNVQTYVDARHLAHAVNLFRQNDMYGPLKNMSALVRGIIEDWIHMQGGCKVNSLDDALDILDTVQMAPERTPRSKYRRIDKENYIQEARLAGAYNPDELISTPTDKTNLRNSAMTNLTDKQREFAKAAEELLKSGLPLKKEN